MTLHLKRRKCLDLIKLKIVEVIRRNSCTEREIPAPKEKFLHRKRNSMCCSKNYLSPWYFRPVSEIEAKKLLVFPIQ